MGEIEMPARRMTMASLEGPGDDGLVPPDPEALLEQQMNVDPDALLAQRKAELAEADLKALTDEPVLTPEEEEEVLDLIHAGRKEKHVTLFNRRIHLRTLTIEEELQVSQITKEFIGSDGYPRAYRTAVVAAAIRSIDGELLYNPLSTEEFKDLIRHKFKVLLDYYPLAVDQVYALYRDMELELLALVEKLGKSQG
jgi:hypothetical protein